jgi:hypothetical protein
MLHAVLTIRRSSIAEIREHEHGLCAMNVRDTHGRDAAVSWDFYGKADDDGVMDCVAAWWGDRMVGYCVAMRYSHPQTAAALSIVVALYALPGHARAGLALRRMLEVSSDIAQASGAERVCVEQSMQGRLGPLLMRLGFAPASVSYEKAVR